MNSPTSPSAIVPSGFRRDLHCWQHLVTPAWVAELVAGAPLVAAPANAWRLLDGGFAAWNSAGLALAYLVDMPQARRLLSEADGALVSIRTWNETIGKTSGYSYIDARGDIRVRAGCAAAMTATSTACPPFTAATVA